MTNNAKKTGEIEKKEKQKPDHVKRNRLKGLAASGVLVTASSTPWSKPMVNSLLLPAHAQTSPTPPTADTTNPAEPMGGEAGPGVGAAMMSFTVTDPDTNMASQVNAPFGFKVGMVNTTTGNFEVIILPMTNTASLTPSPGILDLLVQPAIAQTANQVVITGGTLTGTVDLVNGGAAQSAGNLILGTGEGVGCDCPVMFTVQYNAATGRIEFDQAAFELDYDISEFIGTCAALNLNITELGGITITVPAEDFEVVPVSVPGPPALVFSKTSVSVVEDSYSLRIYSIHLSTRPTGDVTLITSSNDSALGLSTSSRAPRVFTPNNYDRPWWINATAGGDGDTDDETVILTTVASGGGYDGVSGSVTVTVTDHMGMNPYPKPTGATVMAGTAAGTLDVSWIHPVPNNVDYYVVYYIQVDSGALIGEWVESERLDPATTRYTITGLTSGEQYWVGLSTYYDTDDDHLVTADVDVSERHMPVTAP